MKKEYTITKMAGERWFIKFTEPNAKEETVLIELCKCTDIPDKTSIPKMWVKNGYIDRVLETYWHVNTYVKDTKGYSYMYYNPQVKPDTGKINFEWMFEATEENKNKIIDEVYRLATA